MTVNTMAPLGAVLAGGRSERLGRDKAEVELGGRTLVERAVSTLREVFSEVVLVSLPRRVLDLQGVEVVPDLESGQGPLGGIATAIRRARGRSIFVLACDLPFVTSDLVRHVCDWSRADEIPGSERDSPVVRVPQWMGGLQPLCAVYRTEALAHVDGALSRGERGVRQMLLGAPIDVIDLDPRLPFVHSYSFLNINRPQDLIRANDLFVQHSHR